MRHTISLEAPGRIKVDIHGDSTLEIAKEFTQQLNALLSREPKQKFNVLVCMAQAGVASADSLKEYAKLMNHAQINKIAFYEAAAVPLFFVKAMIMFSRKESVKIFQNKEDAFAWCNI